MRAILLALLLAPGLVSADTVGYPGGPGAAIDHGTVSGLGDDDHTQYLLESLYDANGLVCSVSDNTPIFLSVAAGTVVGRAAAGGVDDLSGTSLMPIVNDALRVNAESVVLEIIDDSPVSIAIVESTNDWLYVDTSNGAEAFWFGDADIDPDYVFLGGGEVDADNGTLRIPEGASTLIGGSAAPAQFTSANLLDLLDGGATTLHSHAAPAGTITCTEFLVPAGSGAGNAGNLNSSPVTLVAAPGADEYLHFVSVHLFLDYGGNAYDGVAPAITVRYTNIGGAQVANADAGSFLNATADTHLLLQANTTSNIAPVAAAALVLCASTDPFVAAGDSPIYGEVCYYTRDFTPSP